MANERQQQSQKSYRHKSRAARTLSRAGNPPEAKTIDVNDFVSPIPNKSADESTSATIETMNDLVSSLCHENITTDAAVAKQESSRESGNAWSLAIDSKLSELMERSKSFERERLEIESLREQLKQAIESAESRLVSSGSDQGIARLQKMESQLIAAQQENTKVSTLLLHTRAEYQSLLSFIESEAIDAENSQAKLTTIAQRVIKKTNAREIELSLEVSQLNDQLQFLKSELEDAKSVPSPRIPDDSELRLQIEQLRSQLLKARNETVELRLQTNDLSSRLANNRPGVAKTSETLSWEHRKEALLQQLEAESHSETVSDPTKALEIERILEQTTQEIERRNSEIGELKALLEQQAIARDGMSIGVSAIAEMIESDALIVSERLRLQELREEWEQKQRQAEIEMSMERAKLARERLELQEKTQQYSDNNPPQTEEEKKSGKAGTRGRWLARLGLRDE